MLRKALRLSGEGESSPDLARWDWLLNCNPRLQEMFETDDYSDNVLEFVPDLAEILVSQGKTDDARGLLSRAASQGNSDAWLPLGNILWESGDPLGAFECFQQGMIAGDAHSAFNAGMLRLEEGETEEAKRYFRQAASGGDRRARRQLSHMTSAQKRDRRKLWRDNSKHAN
jgi:tetratricopeptide (TPR) repeat protein